jgi:hypothetical protein
VKAVVYFLTCGRRPLHRFQALTIWYVWAIGVFIQSYLIDFFFIKRNNYHRVVPVFLPVRPQL